MICSLDLTPFWVILAAPVITIIAFALWVRVTFPKKEYCSYHPDVELTDAYDEDTPTPCIKCWDEYRYPEEEF